MAGCLHSCTLALAAASDVADTRLLQHLVPETLQFNISLMQRQGGGRHNATYTQQAAALCMHRI